jgi:hypothetical protein
MLEAASPIAAPTLLFSPPPIMMDLGTGMEELLGLPSALEPLAPLEPTAPTAAANVAVVVEDGVLDPLELLSLLSVVVEPYDPELLILIFTSFDAD